MYGHALKDMKPALQQVHHKWQDQIELLEKYTLTLQITKVIWEYPSPGWVKVNTYGASRGNLGRSAIGFVLRNEGTNTEAEEKAVLEAMRYCVEHDYILIELHIDSILIKNVVNGEWSIPWCVAEYVEEIKELIARCNVTVAHTLRERNSLADHLANYALEFGSIEAHCFWELDIQGRRIVNNDKLQCPYLRIRVARN
ncbi:uncharacterized protein [Nicotiana tomentosiformis]|uniref:uncharacterized protein n=1 Tax=Nicotiana tomentosiformis TaxID=4098 RepID=UPI00388CD7C0